MNEKQQCIVTDTLLLFLSVYKFLLRFRAGVVSRLRNVNRHIFFIFS